MKIRDKMHICVGALYHLLSLLPLSLLFEHEHELTQALMFKIEIVVVISVYVLERKVMYQQHRHYNNINILRIINFKKYTRKNIFANG